MEEARYSEKIRKASCGMAAEKDAKSGAEPEELPEEPACFKVCRMAEAEAFFKRISVS